METTKSAFMDKYLTPIAVLVAAVIIALALIYGHIGGAATGGAGAPQPAVSVNIKDVKTDGDPFIGKADAPVTVALFYDYQCPFF
jgi:protein-disulfide isomerase